MELLTIASLDRIKMTNKQFLVDGMLSGTGIRNATEGGYIKPSELGISHGLSERISVWLSGYADLHYGQYKDDSQRKILDVEGMEICYLLRKERPDLKFDYFSDARMEKM